jgi:hypothetical protein
VSDAGFGSIGLSNRYEIRTPMMRGEDMAWFLAFLILIGVLVWMAASY